MSDKCLPTQAVPQISPRHIFITLTMIDLMTLETRPKLELKPCFHKINW